MPHELDMSRGVAAIAYAGKTPWHRLGTQIDHLMTAKEALTAAQLDFTVAKVPVEYIYNDSVKMLDGHYVVTRTDTGQGFGVVGEQYSPIQNASAFEFLDSLVQSSELRYETAGAIYGGKRVWMLAKLPTSTRLSHDDVVDHYLLMTNSHDGHKSCAVGFTTVRVVCQNTLSVAITKLKHEYRIRHSGSITSKLDEAQHVLGLAKSSFSEFNAKSLALSFKHFKLHEVSPFLDYLFGIEHPSQRTRRDVAVQNEIIELLETGAGAELSTARGTYWGMVNAVTAWVDHKKPVRHGGRTESDISEAHLDMVTWRHGAAIKQRAFDYACELCEV